MRRQLHVPYIFGLNMTSTTFLNEHLLTGMATTAQKNENIERKVIDSKMLLCNEFNQYTDSLEYRKL